MTGLQLYILVALPLVGILTNTGLFLHLSGRLDRLGERVHDDLQNMNKALTSVEIDVALLKGKVGL